MKYAPLLLLANVLTLVSCATGPKFDTTDINQGMTPQQAIAESEVLQGTGVMWGGMVISVTNLKQVTQFEILAYPLSANQKPQVEQTPLGRFLARYTGYLETRDYQQGRLITVTGKLSGKSVGRIGESDYTYPVLEITQPYLWPKQDETPQTRFHFGIGIMIRN